MVPRPLTVLIVDDQALIRSALCQLLACQPQVEHIVLAQDYAEAKQHTAQLRPDIIWLDLHLTQAQSATAIGCLRLLAPACRILAVAQVEDEQEALAAIMAGAQGYRSKQDVELDEIMSIIQSLCRDEFVLRPALLARLLQRLRAAVLPLWASHQGAVRPALRPTTASTGLTQLTGREREILQTISQGYRDREIARGLHITEKTVQKHVQRILSKLGAHSRTEAAYLLHTHSLLSNR